MRMWGGHGSHRLLLTPAWQVILLNKGTQAKRIREKERKSERIRALQYTGEVLTYKNAQTSHLSLNSNGSVLFQQTITHYFVFGGKLPQVSHHWCRFTMGSVNILTSAAQHSGTVQAVSSLPMTPQHHVENTGSQTQLGPLVKNETVIEMVQRTTTVLSSVWFTGMCVCVCVWGPPMCVSHSFPSTSLPSSFPPQAASPLLYEWELLHLSPQDTLQCLNVSICGGSDTHSLTPWGIYP